MKEESDKQPRIKILNEDEYTPPPQEKPIQLKIIEEVEILKPDIEAREILKIHEADISNLLNKEEEQTDIEESWANRKKMAPVGWLILAGILIISLGGWATLSLFQAEPEIIAANQEKQELLVEDKKDDEEVKETLRLMEDCARGYLAADSIETMLPFVRQPERLKPLMEHYYKEHSLQPVDFLKFKRFRSIGLESQSFLYGKIQLQDGSTRKILLEQLEDGSFRADWESDVCYLPMKWETYIKTRPTETMDMRIYLTPDHFYSYEFRDDSRFTCYKLTSRDSDAHLFGYVEKGTPVAIDIEKITSNNKKYGGDNKKEPMILRLRFPKKGDSKQSVWIDALVAPRWIYATSPLKK